MTTAKGNNMNAQQAFSLFTEINTVAVITASSVYWTALDAERDGVITVDEMDAISVYHKNAIVDLAAEHAMWVEAEAAEMAAVSKAQADYWTDYENGEFEL